ncbi:hypothetical protein RMCBS344292_07722 [Rhizopus microsporus]|nr:hypothetical protein RMCBS344292_07722 [Rhizopus microsporus]
MLMQTKSTSQDCPITVPESKLTPVVLDKVSLLDILFTETYNKTPPGQVIYAEASNPEINLTFEQLKHRVLVCATALKNGFNLQPGDVVGICSQNNIMYPILFFGSIAAGCVVAPLRPSDMLSSEELANDIATVVPKLLIVHQWEMQHTFTALGRSGIPKPPILLLNEPNEKIDEAYANMPTVDALVFSNEPAQPYQYTNEELANSPCCLYFTSGSTGRSKAVMISQNAIISQLLYIAGSVRCQCNNLVFTNFSFASSFGLYLIFGICSGMTSYILDKNKSTLEGLCDAIERLKIKAVALPPGIVNLLVKSKQVTSRYDLSSLQKIYFAGGFVDMSIVMLVKRVLNVQCVNLFGMTESLGIFVSNECYTLAGSVGRLSRIASARIVNEEGRDVSVGDIGELRIKSPSMTIGYYKDAQATAELFDEQGYMRTGDIFRMDDRGLFYYVSRSKDLIRQPYINIHATEIESVINRHPNVEDCAVVGVYSEEHAFELPRAYVSLIDKGITNKTVEEIYECVNSQLPSYKQLSGRIFVIDSFPRTGSGKIKRFELV